MMVAARNTTMPVGIVLARSLKLKCDKPDLQNSKYSYETIIVPGLTRKITEHEPSLVGEKE
jgi:hypothetical protein